MIKRLDLIWRVVGTNIILTFLGIYLLSIQNSNGAYMVVTNLMFVLMVSFHLVRKKLTINSNILEILTVYFVCRIVVDICYTQSVYECVIAILSILIGFIWMLNFLWQKNKSES